MTNLVDRHIQAMCSIIASALANGESATLLLRGLDSFYVAHVETRLVFNPPTLQTAAADQIFAAMQNIEATGLGLDSCLIFSNPTHKPTR